MTTQIKKDLIATAALACFKQSGYGGASVDDIVKRSGLSKGGIYWHFKSKEEIFLYLLEKEIETEISEAAALPKQTATASERLREYINWRMRKTLDSSIHMLMPEFVTRAKRPDTIERLKKLMTYRQDGFKIVYDILEQGALSGEFPAIDYPVMAELYFALIEGIVTRYYIFHRDAALLKKTFATAEDIFIESISNK